MRASTIFHFFAQANLGFPQELKKMNYGPGMVMEGNFSEREPNSFRKRDPEAILKAGVFLRGLNGTLLLLRAGWELVHIQ